MLRLPPSANMDAKRRRHETNVFRDLARVDCLAELAETREKAGQALRKLLLRKYVLGKFVAEDVTLISHFHMCAGGCGLADLALPPSRSKGHSHHLDMIMQQEYEEPALYAIVVPTFNKHSCIRTQARVPMNLPSRALKRDAAAGGLNCEVATGIFPMAPAAFGPVYEQHPAVVRCRQQGMPESKIRPVALYWDGVQYGKKQSFVAMPCHDLKANKKHLCFLIRVALIVDQTRCVIRPVFSGGVDKMQEEWGHVVSVRLCLSHVG